MFEEIGIIGAIASAISAITGATIGYFSRKKELQHGSAETVYKLLTDQYEKLVVEHQKLRDDYNHLFNDLNKLKIDLSARHNEIIRCEPFLCSKLSCETRQNIGVERNLTENDN